MYTVDQILSMPQDVAESAFQALRDELHRCYLEISPRTLRGLGNRWAVLSAAGDSHAKRAQEEQERTRELRSEYGHNVHIKSLLAIWAGRYDEFLNQADSPCGSGHTTDQEDFGRVWTARRALKNK